MAFSDSDSSDTGGSIGSRRGHASGSNPGLFRPRRAFPASASPRRSPDSQPPHILPSETSSLLHQLNDDARPEHGTFTPSSLPDTGTDRLSASDFEPAERADRERTKQPSWRARLSRRIKSKKVRNSRHLAREAGVEYNKMM